MTTRTLLPYKLRSAGIQTQIQIQMMTTKTRWNFKGPRELPTKKRMMKDSLPWFQDPTWMIQRMIQTRIMKKKPFQPTMASILHTTRYPNSSPTEVLAKNCTHHQLNS